MNIQSAFSSSLYGIAQANQGINQNAKEIANNSLSHNEHSAEQNSNANKQLNSQAEQQTNQSNVVDNLVDLENNKLQASANIKALQTSNNVLGSLIDIRV